ncbi:MAG: helix-turn-helix transcriptional regulator [Malacoplasma sp.]|nr:helix-turn-helix transcriptional regulator [Malacoplasma sp.]
MDYKVMVKKLRNKMFLTQSEFAKELGVSIASVARWGTSENEPTMKIKRRLNDLFIKYSIETGEH